MPRPRKVRLHGFVLLWAGGSDRRVVIPDDAWHDPPPSGVLLSAAPLVPRAADALGPAGLARRIDLYSRRARRRLPLFDPRG